MNWGRSRRRGLRFRLPLPLYGPMDSSPNRVDVLLAIAIVVTAGCVPETRYPNGAEVAIDTPASDDQPGADLDVDSVVVAVDGTSGLTDIRDTAELRDSATDVPGPDVADLVDDGASMPDDADGSKPEVDEVLADEPSTETDGDLPEPDDGPDTPCADAGGPKKPEAGDLIITEVMHTPASPPGQIGQWFEVTNTSVDTLTLEGVAIRLGDVAVPIVPPIAMEPGAYVVMASQNNGITDLVPAFVYGQGIDLTPPETPATVTIELVIEGGQVIEAFGYGQGAPSPPAVFGASIQQDPSSEGWCLARSGYASGDWGTPGQANEACPIGCSEDIAGACDGGCEGGLCRVTALKGVCPAGWPCELDCSGDDDCGGAVFCNDGPCRVSCTGQNSCAGDITCGAGPCEIECGTDKAPGACKGAIVCKDADSCKIDCLGASTCPTTKSIECDARYCMITCGTGLAPGSCAGLIDCSESKHCDVSCVGSQTCEGGVTCGTETCDVVCGSIGDQGNSCAGLVDCSKTADCAVECAGVKTCTAGVECGAGQCDVVCEWNASCGEIVGGTGPVDVSCTDTGSCTTVDCSKSCGCDVTCASCSQQNITCPDNCSSSNGCSSYKVFYQGEEESSCNSCGTADP